MMLRARGISSLSSFRFPYGLSWAALLCVLSATGCSSTLQTGPIDSEQGPHRRQLWIIPHESGTAMRAVVYRPQGAEPFPLAVISHGSAEDPVARSEMRDPDYPHLARWLVERGFVVVIPQRPGHGQTGGPYLESVGYCDNPNYLKAALATAQSIESTIAYMHTQPFVQQGPALLVGHSAGGWGSLGLAGTKPDLVGALVIFSAGLGGRSEGIANKNCAPERLISTAAELGRGARAPSLWIYAENDTYFRPEIGRKLAASFGRGGAPLTFFVGPSVQPDGHFLVHDSQATMVWSAPLSQLIKHVGWSRTAPRS